MKKIPTMFLRDEKYRARVTETIDPRCEWVLNGEGIATVKFDGTAVLIETEFGLVQMLKRYDAKPGRTPPPFFRPCEPGADPITGHWPGWVPVTDFGAEDQYLREAFQKYRQHSREIRPGTYECCGPKINGNPHNYYHHMLIPHGSVVVPEAPRSYGGLLAYLTMNRMEGIVWHHRDGRMAKVKSKDLGLPWPVRE